MTDGVPYVPPTQRQKLLLSAIGGSLVLASILALLLGQQLQLPALPAFVPFYAGLVFLTGLVTAYLLSSQYRVGRKPSILILSSAYLYSGLSALVHLIFFPGILSGEGWMSPTSQVAVWLWAIWHCGFPICVLLSVMCERISVEV